MIVEEKENLIEIEIGGGPNDHILIDKVFGPHVYGSIDIWLDKTNNEWVITFIDEERPLEYRTDGNVIRVKDNV